MGCGRGYDCIRIVVCWKFETTSDNFDSSNTAILDCDDSHDAGFGKGFKKDNQ